MDRVFSYECEGRPEPKFGPRPPQCDDWYALLVEPADQGRVNVKIAVQANGTGAMMRDWLCEIYSVDEHNVSILLPAHEQARLRNALTSHLEGIGYEEKAKAQALGLISRLGTLSDWAWIIAVFFAGVAVGAI